jgi:UDP-N-acetylmuramoyl-tripeptide--D-alanyl-D-alanine ligase
MKFTLHKILALLARLTIKKYKPEVIAVTGSYGKSSTKEAIFATVRLVKRAGHSHGSYNNELGLPLAVLGEISPGRSVKGWLYLFGRALKRLFVNDWTYPELLVLEMGADKPGDIAKLVKIAPPTTGVLTSIANVHREFYPSLKAIATEKRSLLKALPRNGCAIINVDDDMVAGTKLSAGLKIIGYGMNGDADVRGSEAKLWFDLKNGEIAGGIRFKVEYRGSVIPVQIPGTLGKPVIYAALAAFAVGVSRGDNPLDTARALDNYRPLPGRLRLLAGIKNSAIIDDSYNASPDAMRAAIDVLNNDCMKEYRRWAVLGDMRELGLLTEIEHQKIGAYVAESKIERLVTVGARAKIIAAEAVKQGMSKANISSFDEAMTAGKYIQSEMEEGDVVLVKGSQGVGKDMIRLEKVVIEIMHNPELAEYLLVRQGKEWK